MSSGSFETVARRALETVVGGRTTELPQKPADPALLQAIAQLAQTVQQVGAGLAQAGKESQQGTSQMMQQMMQAKQQGK
ncbi:hypothetical protein BH11MYX1_BH11MYX1_16480 [soil metagenome]